MDMIKSGSLMIVTGRWPDIASHAADGLGTQLRGSDPELRCSRRHSSRAFRSRRPLLLPLLIGPLQQVLGAGTAQVRAAILHHHLAVDVTCPIRDQKACKISKLAVFAGATQRIFR